MHPALRIAAICSVALHLTILVSAQRLFDSRGQPSIASRVLVLTLRGLEVERDEEPKLSLERGASEMRPADNVEVSTAVPDPSVAPAKARTAATVAAREGPPAERAPPVTTQAAGESPQAQMPAEAIAGSDETHEVRLEVASTTTPSAQRMPTEAPHAAADSQPVSPEQQQMLDRKLDKWAESYERKRMTGMPWKSQGQEYVATFTREPAPDDLGIEHVIIEVSTQTNGRKLSTRVRMRRLAFSNYAQFVNRWDPAVSFHDDELDGRFHSNSEIVLDRDGDAVPTFYGKVTTAAHSVDYGDEPGYIRRDRIFVGGLETGVGTIQFPERFVPFPEDSTPHADRVRYFDADTRITFYADGSYGWQDIGATSDEQHAAISEGGAYLISAGKAELHVAGTVNGKVLLYSPERIVIEGNLVYAQDPAAIPDADDYLGLVSDKYIDIAPADVTGAGDLTVNAAIYAKRCFAVKGYGVKNGGLLSVYGSLTAGSLSATEPRYRTRVRFDRRLEKLRPPAFPMTDRYEVESWDGVWKVATPQATL